LTPSAKRATIANKRRNMNQQSLFPLTVRPTTRAIADAVRGVGAAALPSAERKADDARYQEVRCRSALNHVKGMPFEWTLNPYRGCTHGCHYCFARRYHKQFELDSDDEFASVILVKTNLVEVLGRELAQSKWERNLVAMGTATDPYQPIEGHYRLSRRSLVELAAARTPVSIVTKGPMVVRDIDVLKDVAAAAKCTVCMSVPSVDEDAWKKMEPGTAHPFQRLKAVRALTRAGIRAGVLMAPLVPGITTARHGVDATLAAIADHGASFVGANVLHLEGGTRDHFFRFLERTYPHLVDGYARLYANGAKRAPKAYSQAVQDTVDDARERVGMSGRGQSDGGREQTDGEYEGDDGEMRPEARDALLWETAVIES
jgi:DNA repair photolyase